VSPEEMLEQWLKDNDATDSGARTQWLIEELKQKVQAVRSRLPGRARRAPSVVGVSGSTGGRTHLHAWPSREEVSGLAGCGDPAREMSPLPHGSSAYHSRGWGGASQEQEKQQDYWSLFKFLLFTWMFIGVLVAQRRAYDSFLVARAIKDFLPASQPLDSWSGVMSVRRRTRPLVRHLAAPCDESRGGPPRLPVAAFGEVDRREPSRAAHSRTSIRHLSLSSCFGCVGQHRGTTKHAPNQP
jgi:hypothetical protein